MTKDIEREETKSLKKAIKELYEECDLLSEEEKDEFDNLFSRALRLGEMRERLKLEGCVVVPVEPTPKMIDSTWGYQDEIDNMSHNSRNAFIYKNMIRVAIEEAARGGNENT